MGINFKIGGNMRIPEYIQRGFNRQESIAYLGVKGSFFDKSIRPRLKGMRMGTAMIFDRIELDTIFDEFKLAAGDVGPTTKGVATWPKNSREFLQRKTNVGESTNATKEIDFKDVLNRIKRRKTGC
jgi:hypothetical protein